ncbi:uncharacterized protein TNCV_4508821 [Trichonephila clavipes]|nr:uncharacterized protein TNCV_4508821 [Trichonephila clavipes]
MEPGSKAERLVLSFPATAANYPKAIDQLKERFGREGLLVQIYVRDLLTLVMKNAATGRVTADLPLLYDELESKLRSLESLGKTQDKYGDFLMPLVESCLPEEVLVAWKRSRNHQTESEGSRSLEQLMNFLRQEVKGEEMVLSARTGLTLHQNPRKKDYHATQVNRVETTTAAAIVNMYNPGISSPTEIEKRKTELSLNDFNNKRKILPDGSERRIVHRHCRVVFGVSSSPFLLNASIMHLLENCQPQHEEVAQKLKCSFYVDNCVSENSVKEIRQLTRGHLWKQVPGNLNIADLLSRGCSPPQMLTFRWWEGPLWLRESPEYWPLGETPGDSEEVELERKKLNVVNIDISRDTPSWHLYAISEYSKMI